MTYRLAPTTEKVIWRAALHHAPLSLAAAVRETLTRQRAHLLDFIRLDEPHPHHALTLAEWSRPATLRSLQAIYGDHIYRNQPHQPREGKPLLSLWAQWYLGLLVPPVLLALLTQEVALDVSPEHFHVEFHETGRAACFWIDVQPDSHTTQRNDSGRAEALIVRALMPVINALESTGEINGKLIWSNTGYLINWYLNDIKPLLGEERVAALRQRCFFDRQLSDGTDNPLWRTVVLRDGQLVRRTCCQRYRLPDVQQCGDCTLK